MAERGASGGLVLAVDGNSLVHRAYHALAHTGTRSLADEPVWAVRGLLVQLVEAVDRVGPTHVVVGFDDAGHSERRAAHPVYKAQRPEKLPTLVSQLELAAVTLRRIGLQVEVPTGLEADDVLASTAARVRERDGRTVIVTSDRDAFALVDDRTSVLRIINGGVEASPLLNPERLQQLVGVTPAQYPDLAALRGDPSDNLPGVRGIGPKTAAKLLAAFGSAEAVFDADPDALRTVVGPACTARLAEPGAREAWSTNRRLMTMRDDLRIDPGAGPGALPLDSTPVRQAYLTCRLPHTRDRALRALCHQQPADGGEGRISAAGGDGGAVESDTLAWDATAEWRSRPAYPRLPDGKPDPQPALF